MRHLICILACSFGLHAGASTQVPGTASELADDALGRVLWRIAFATKTRIGFQSIDHVRLPGTLAATPSFPISSRDEALTAAVGVDPRYEFRSVGDFVIVRPKSAWNDPADPFNRPVHNLRVENAMSGDVVLGLRDFIYTNRFAPVPSLPGGPLVSFDVQSGTVVDALNQLMESTDTLLWVATYRPNAHPDQRARSWDLEMQLMGATLHFFSGSGPPRGLK
jgi:hypothetical protein